MGAERTPQNERPPSDPNPPKQVDPPPGRPMNILRSLLARQADDRSMDVIATLIEEAGDDDHRLLELLRENAEITKRHQERIWSARDAAAKRLRDAGVPMTEIAEEAGVTDSYLSRRLIEAGAKRIVDRTRRSRRRRNGGSSPPPQRRTG